ncbi:MAG: PAS domain-containing protein [Betaproteobacteria bacterium]|nr:PAS domain-containing protein [Betaproteobacteria bacterium]
MKKKPDHRSAKRTPTYVVGIGASAGGLEALRALFGSLKVAPRNMSFVVVQHLAPLHRSRLVELIASTTRLSVAEVRDGMAPERGVIHITPPNANLIVDGGRLRLKGTGVGPKPSVDTFFRSLAQDFGPRAVGIVLSGSGSDGAAGIKSIREAGGVTLAQRPESAKYDSMPKAAIHTAAVDAIMPPEEMARELVRIASHRPGKRPRPAAGRGDAYENIMRILERQVGVDFFKYKQSTIRRRLERRLIATGCTTLDEYARYLERTQGEAQNLLQNILISVTSFFRDAEAFKALGQHVQEKIRVKRDAQHYRCWVAGCATGEEAFSLAILLSEAIERAKSSLRLHIFATDLDEHALAFARRATYPAASLVGLPARLIDKYFQPLEDGTYQVRTSLRDTVVFARHNATEDPPFLNLDLVSCRNVLIYFNGKLQEKLFQTFEYALGRGGILFLGKSEAIPHGSSAFRLIGRRQKIFERLATRGDVPSTSRREAIRESAFINRAKELGQALDLFNSVVAGLAPDSIVIDSQLYIKHIYGSAGELLMHPPGQATQNIAKLLPPELGAEMLALVHKSDKTGRSAGGRRHEFKLKNQLRAVEITVVPLPSAAEKDFLVCFHSYGIESKRKSRKHRDTSGMAPAEQVSRLQSELAEVREHLQTVMEEHETANEEAQSLNEELQSSNEELQSANEELETTNEELQSSNEELTTVNEELNVKTTELQSMNQRLHAIQNAITYPLLVFDRAKRLLNFNPAARQLFRLSEGDIGGELGEAGTLGEAKSLMRLIETALTRKKDPRLQLEHAERSFEVQIQLFRNVRGGVEGGVASLVDNTDITRALAENRTNRERLSSILEATPAIVTMKDLGGSYIYANRRFCDMLHTRPESVIGHTDEELFGKDVAAELREHDLEVVKRKKATEVTEHYLLDGKGRVWSSSKFPLFDAKRRVQSVCAVSLDMTDRIAYEQQLELFKRAFSASNQGVLILEPEVGKSGKDLRVAFASDAIGALAESTPSKLSGLGLQDVLEQLALPAQAPDGAHIASQIGSQAECVFVLPSDRGGDARRWLEVRSCKFDPGRVVLTFVDVTQRVRDQRTIELQQEELGRITRFSALSEIAAGIAHEVNTPLSVIMAKADILRAKASAAAVEPGDANVIAMDIAKMAKNVSDIVHGLATVATSKSNRLEKADLKRVIADAAKLCEPRAHRINADLKLDLAEGEVPVECYPVQILQIVINLINNAIDAVAERRDKWVRVKLRTTPHEAQVTVTDSGPGISSGLAEKIFTPFFTTKKDRDGTGIGLSLSRSIARRHHGELTLDMHAANTSFRVVLPRKQPDRRVVVLDSRVEPSIAYTKPKAAGLNEARPGRR